MRIRILLLLSCLLALAAATVGAASASAELCKAGGTGFALCREINSSELELVATGLFLILLEEATTNAFTVLTTTHIVVTCLTAEGTGATEGELGMKGKLEFKECTVTSPAACEVPATMTAEKIDGRLSLALELEPEATEELTRLDLLLEPEEEEGSFATFTLKSKTGETCPLAGTEKVKGSILCYWLEVIEEDLELHLFECNESGSSLTVAGTAADLTGEFSVLMLEANGANHEDSHWGIFQDVE